LEPEEPSYENMFPASTSFSKFFKELYEYELSGTAEIEKHIKNGKKAEVERLLDKGYDIETENEFKCTPIETAAIQNQTDIIQLLFERGAKLRNSLKYAKNNYSYFPEHKASVDLLEKLKKTRRPKKQSE
jgi:ankyrin repeat protein